MDMYKFLKQHHADHIYKRGAYKGDAPMSQRYKSNFRVIDYADRMVVRLYNTNIITALPNGNITINTNGYYTATTFQSINEALGRARVPIRISSKSIKGMSQMCAFVGGWNGTVHRFYDGITFDADGKLLSEAKPMRGRRINREKSKAFQEAIKASGFKGLFPVLYSMAEPEDRVMLDLNALKFALTDTDHADVWKGIVAQYKFVQYWDWNNGNSQRVWRSVPKEKVWASLMTECKASMYETYDVEA